MKIFLDTSDISVIKKYLKTGIIDGVTTNPSTVAKLGQDPTKIIKEICMLMQGKDVSVEVTMKKPDDVYKQAKEIARLANNVVVKIPCHLDYYPVIHKLVQENIPLNITLVFTLIQGLYMAKLGVKYISPFVGRWDDNDADGLTPLYELREMMDEYGYTTEILAASMRTVGHLHHAVLAGVDVATLKPKLFSQSCSNILTNEGIKKFLDDWKKLNIDKFPSS